MGWTRALFSTGWLPRTGSGVDVTAMPPGASVGTGPAPAGVRQSRPPICRLRGSLAANYRVAIARVPLAITRAGFLAGTACTAV